VLALTDETLLLHEPVNRLVDLVARFIVRRNDQRAVRVFGIFARNGGEPLVAVDNLMHATLPLEQTDRGGYVAARQLLDDLFQRRILLSHDGVEPDGPDARFLQLLVRSTGFNGLMLPHVSHQQHTVPESQTLEELMHLRRARETGFIDDIQPSVPVRGLVTAREVALQRRRRNACICQLLRGARGGREAFDQVPASLGRVLRSSAFMMSSNRRVVRVPSQSEESGQPVEDIERIGAGRSTVISPGVPARSYAGATRSIR